MRIGESTVAVSWEDTTMTKKKAKISRRAESVRRHPRVATDQVWNSAVMRRGNLSPWTAEP